MNISNVVYLIIPVVVVLVIIGIVLGLVFSRRKRTEQLQDHFGQEYEHTVQTLGNEKKAQTELDERKKHVEALDIRSLSVVERTVIWWNGPRSNPSSSTNLARRSLKLTA